MKSVMRAPNDVGRSSSVQRDRVGAEEVALRGANEVLEGTARVEQQRVAVDPRRDEQP